jgi:hypothetical protein
LNYKQRPTPEYIFSIFEDIINPFLTAQEPGVYVYTGCWGDTNQVGKHTSFNNTDILHAHTRKTPIDFYYNY